MRSNIYIAVGLIMVAASSAQAQDVTWRAAKPAQDSTPLTLGSPVPLVQTSFVPITPASPPADADEPRVVRGQGSTPPPPPPFPGAESRRIRSHARRRPV